MNSLRARIRIPENRKLIPYKKGKKNRKKNLTMLKKEPFAILWIPPTILWE